MKKFNIQTNYPLSALTSFKTGGVCHFFATPHCASELLELLSFLREEGVPAVVLGKGSNVLASDKGFDGAVICPKFTDITLDQDEMTAGAGVINGALVSFAHQNGLTGLEFLGGIPGTVGGAVVMNAGAYDWDVRMFLKTAKVLTKDFAFKDKTPDDLELSYRHSNIEALGHIVLSATFYKLHRGDVEKGKQALKELNTRRREKQPLNFPSAGSTFKRPPGFFAGKLIQDCGLSGFAIGGAQVSEKHCGFIINTGDATSQEIYNLIRHVQEVVAQKTGVFLEPEIKFLGEFS